MLNGGTIFKGTFNFDEIIVGKHKKNNHQKELDDENEYEIIKFKCIEPSDIQKHKQDFSSGMYAKCNKIVNLDNPNT